MSQSGPALGGGPIEYTARAGYASLSHGPRLENSRDEDGCTITVPSSLTKTSSAST